MGCSTSKLDDEEAVQLCKDRKNFIKEAVEQRMRFASGHAAYIQSLKRVSAALRDYVEGDEQHDLMLDAFTTPAFTPIKKSSTGFISISPKSFSVSPIQTTSNSTIKVNYLRSGGNPSVSVEERPHSPETVRVEAYSPIHQYEMDGFFAMQSPPMNNSFFNYSPIHRPSFPPPSPRTSQWDFFWNPFSSLDNYGYPTRTSLDHTVLDDDISGLRQVREEEGIPELEEETEQEDLEPMVNVKEQAKVVVNSAREEVLVEDDDSDDDDDDDDDYVTDSGTESEHEVTGPVEAKLELKKSQASQKLEVSKLQNAGQVSNQETAVGDNRDANEETPGFTVYVNRRPTSMTEVVKDLEAQFKIICNSAIEVSAMLEASKAQYTSTSNELTAMKMLNPVALLRSASSRSSSARFAINSSSSKDEAYESSSDFSEESCTFSGSHQSTLDKLYAWEKKLYQEVRAGERVRIAYEKKCTQLRNKDVKGDDPSSVDKTRAAIRDLHTQIKVSIHSVEAVSKRIETLRDEELQPQLLDLIQGLTRMWKVMADCHLSQKRILDDAKLLLAGTPSKLFGTKKYTLMSPTEPHRLACAASNLENELRNWRACFESWITSQRSYIHALTGWLLRCVRSDADASNLPFSPRRSMVTSLPIYGICIQWSRFLDAVREVPVLDGLDFCVAGIGSLYAQQLKEDFRHRTPTGSKRYGGGFSAESGGKEMVEVGHLEEDVFSAEKLVEVAIRVLCAGMSVVVSSLTEYAISSAQGYGDVVKQWESAQRARSLGGTRKQSI